MVEALTQKSNDNREVILGVEGGLISLEAPQAEPEALCIPCKIPLRPARRRPDPPSKEDADRGKNQEGGAGLVVRNLSKLSREDADAAHELLKDALRSDTDDPRPDIAPIVPILARSGAKRSREGPAPEATRDMFNNVPVASFGEALLRGMGYDPAADHAKPVYREKMRDTYLGLGAKPLLPHEKLAASQHASSAKAKATSSVALVDEKLSVAAQPEQKKPRTELWASRGLIVRVIAPGEFYGAEAVVLEACEASQTCRIKARVKGVSRIHEVSIEDLETRVSRECDSVRVVRGARRGSVLSLLRRDVARRIAVVRGTQGAASEEMPLDDVCQFMS